MHELIEIQKKLLPDLIATLTKRYQILRSIRFMEPVGRRSLAQNLGMTERVLRSEVDFLKDQGLIEVKSAGMNTTVDGQTTLFQLEGMMREFSGINVMEEEIRQRFTLRKVVIVPGDSDESPWVKEELGRATVLRMKEYLAGNNIIAVTGGTTMSAIADQLTPGLTSDPLLFVPARGGIGEDVRNQANTICARMAERAGVSHRVLYMPDQVSEEVYASFVKEPSINEVLSLIQHANMVIHGIGDAFTMAKRRNTNEQDLEKLQEEKAVGEAFGYYFNEVGEVVHKVLTVGLQLDQLAAIPNVIAVAGGASKGKAIAAYLQSAPPNTTLITDEGAMNTLLKGKLPF